MRTAIRKNTRNGHDLTNDWLKIKNAFSDTAYDVKHTANKMLSGSVNTIKNKTKRAKRNMVTYASKKPFTSLGIALASGLAIGLLLKLRNNK